MNITLNKTNSILGVIISIIVLTTSAYGVWSFIDNRYAHASDLSKVELRVNINSLKDTYHDLLRSYHNLKNHSRQYPNDNELKDEIEELKTRKNEIKKQITTFEIKLKQL